MGFALRDYQKKAVAAIQDHLSRVDSTLAVLPTGCGKTEIFVQLANDWHDGRTLVIAPQIELVGQAAKKIRQRTGVQPAIEQGAHQSNESFFLRSPFVCASKQSLASCRGNTKRFERIKDIGLVIVDEAHLAATKAFAEILDHYKADGAKVVGVTATPKRHDNKAMANIFETSAYRMFIKEAVDLGWLVAPRANCAQIESLDLSEVGTKGSRGDFKEGELAKVMEQEAVVFEIAEIAAKESVEGERVLKTVVYCATVNEAQAIAERLRDHHGLGAEWVCGDKKRCPEQKRHDVLGDLAEPGSGVDIVCNVGVLTTGWDMPGLEHIVMGRPTKSLSLYTQIVGRGTRPLPGTVDFDDSTPELRRESIANSAKPHFKLTDIYDNSMQHQLCSILDVLGGEMGLEERRRAAAKLKDRSEYADIDDLMGEVEAELAEEKAARERAEAEERERKRRQAIASKASYRNVAVDPLGGSEGGAIRKRGGCNYRMPFGKYRGQRIGDVPDGYLKWLMYKADTPPRGKLRKMIEGELEERSSTGTIVSRPRKSKQEQVPVGQSVDDINHLFSEAI